MNSKQLYVLFYYVYYTLLASLLFGGLFFLVFGCSHDPLCYEHPHGLTLVRFDWSEAPEAAPAGNRVHFYPEGGGRPTVADFMGLTGGRVWLSPGRYVAVCHNNDTESVEWRGEDSLTTLEGYMRTTTLTEETPHLSAPPADAWEDPLVLAPDRLWVGRVDSVTVTETDTTIVTLFPRRATYLVRWQLDSLEGIGRLLECRVSLTGVAGALRLSDTLPVAYPRGHVSGGRIEASDVSGWGSVSGEFESFGCGRDTSCRHVLTVYLWSRGGNLKKSFDVTDQFHRILPGREILLRISDRLTVPIGIPVGEDGYRPEVEGWEENEEEIVI